MTKKDYIAIAEIIRRTVSDTPQCGVLVDCMSDMFKANNPRFDKTRFMRACYSDHIHKAKTTAT